MSLTDGLAFAGWTLRPRVQSTQANQAKLGVCEKLQGQCLCVCVFVYMVGGSWM